MKFNKLNHRDGIFERLYFDAKFTNFNCAPWFVVLFVFYGKSFGYVFFVDPLVGVWVLAFAVLGVFAALVVLKLDSASR